MVQVKDFNDFKIGVYPCYAFIADKCSSVTMHYETPGGTFEFEDYSAYAHEVGTLIAFKQLLNDSVPYTFHISTETGYKSLLQVNLFERDLDALTGDSSRPHQFYSFLKCVEVSGSTVAHLIPVGERCDVGYYGPRMYDISDGSDATPVDFELMKNGLKSFRVILGMNSVAYISSQELWPVYMHWRNWPTVTVISKTFSGLLKQLCEWKQLYDSGLTDEEVAKDAKDFIDLLGITDEMIAELDNTEISMPVKRYMLGNGDARHGFTETGVLPKSIKSMIAGQSRYETLASLSHNHPSKPQFSQEFTDKEHKYMEEKLFQYIVFAMPTIDPETVTLDQINTSLNFSLEMPPIANTQIFMNGIIAARYFNALNQ